MGDTLPLQVEGACLGRSVTSWTSGCGLSPACWRARRWRRCAPSLASPGRPATRSSTATKTAALARSAIGAAGPIGRPIACQPRSRRRLARLRATIRGGATATTLLTRPTDPNALWCADYKGEFMLGNRRYCYPLTITDFASRYLLTCEALSTTQERFAFTVFERTFKEFGLPQVIRTDNGVPFASAHAIYGLSKLAVW